ncbi:bifunctional glutamate N-acetyltransferase/amino-acid acetyltransferase ArgJ [Amphibacillus jilinensis]|uniref:bifunctional glutamate N-acetyltransferase/amino-acid acetyltransferase ArgJ n=1 Tax=Amphibacillus jilinensis TaxID=1216008 RepID=UPI0002E8A562|nr:bifunctional glutamate N-acetyltransferase/amino-acid acetyltransferase ArgJ [Amphibacillus jilinensis]
MKLATLTEDIKLIEHGDIASPMGYKAGGLHCGIRKKKPDLAWLYSEVPAIAAGVYTTNSFQAAPLIVTRESLAVEQKLQVLLVNSGIANACTGKQGLDDAYEMRDLIADKFNVAPHYAAVSSTGLIGEHLPMTKLRQGIRAVDPMIQTSDQFETAILTTDTKEKGLAVQIEIDGALVTIGGAAKGSGMINPNMATMLSFITTDAKVDADALDLALKEVTNQSFNMITVDGDTSTNDMVLVMANGQANHATLQPKHPKWELFLQALQFVCQTLAKDIARDGEGATKLIEVQVVGTTHDKGARKLGKAVISSNLVKAAIHGSDANWGRIITAIGYSGVDVDPDQVSVKLGDILVVSNGVPVQFDESEAKAYLMEDHIIIGVDVGNGQGRAVGWGCDLSYEYVRINASYRT